MSVPPTSSTAVPTSTSRTVRFHRSGRRRSRRRVSTTGRPRPPKMIAAAIGRQMNGSEPKPMRLSLNSANPALLNAETAWKTPCHSAWPGDIPAPSQKRRLSSSATEASTAVEYRIRARSTRGRSPIPSARVEAAASRRWVRPSRRRITRPSSDVNVMTPRPPSLMSARITTWPRGVQNVWVSTTPRPVTVVALVAVNAASSGVGARP